MVCTENRLTARTNHSGGSSLPDLDITSAYGVGCSNTYSRGLLIITKESNASLVWKSTRSTAS